MKEAPKLVVMASGGGSTFGAIASAVKNGALQAKIPALIVHRADVGAVQVAKEEGLRAMVVDPRDFSDFASWDRALTREVSRYEPDLIVLAGFTRLLGPQFLARFPDRIVNTHPSLLPKYGGKGMYGLKVHQAVLKAGDLETGITVHWVQAGYDTGPTIAQLQVPVVAGDTPQTLAERLKAAEKPFYISVLRDLLNSMSERA